MERVPKTKSKLKCSKSNDSYEVWRPPCPYPWPPRCSFGSSMGSVTPALIQIGCVCTFVPFVFRLLGQPPQCVCLPGEFCQERGCDYRNHRQRLWKLEGHLWSMHEAAHEYPLTDEQHASESYSIQIAPSREIFWCSGKG